MNPVKILALLTWIFQSGLSQRYRLPETVIVSHKRKVPEYCWNSYETIRCYEVCREDPEITAILKIPEFDRGNSVFHRSRHLRETEDKRVTSYMKGFGLLPRPGIEYPCAHKCETDPLYWTCMEECGRRDHTSFWYRRCYDNQNKTCKRGSQLTKECVHCLEAATIERLRLTCEIAYLPGNDIPDKNLCELMSSCGVPVTGIADRDLKRIIVDCAADTHVTPGTGGGTITELLRMCVNDKIMLVQKHCCYSQAVRNGTMCRDNKELCDNECTRILSPRLCRESCEPLRNPKYEECKQNECTFFFPTPPDMCDHCVTMGQEAEAFKTCIDDCPTLSGCLLPTCTSVPSPDWLVRNCHNPEYLLGLVNFLRDFKGIVIKANATSAKWTPEHFTPLDLECLPHCEKSSSPDTASPDCIECLEQRRTTAEILAACQANPYRTIELMACALELELTQLDLKQSTIKYAVDLAVCNETLQNDTLRRQLFKAVYDYEYNIACKKYCERNTTAEPYHPNQLNQMKCEIHHCQPTGQSPYCQPEVDSHVVRFSDFASCRWKVDFTKASDPFVLWGNYFNELGPANIMEKLEDPDTTKVLKKVVVNGKEAFYTFPYFLVVRGTCDNGFYSDGAYRFSVTGGNPTIDLKYQAPTTRHVPRTFVTGWFQSALIKLKRNKEDALIPENPRSIDDSGEQGCHENICYPAFAVPLMFLELPRIQVAVQSQDSFSDLVQTIYVSPFHSRAIEGKGEIQISFVELPAHPEMLFPTKRSSFATDKELSYHQDCIANDVRDKETSDFRARKCPEIEHVLDDFDTLQPAGIFNPLDAEDLLRSQYTFGTSPVQAIAGFYDPRFLIIGDADMNRFEVVNWGKLLKEMERSTPSRKFHACVQPAFTHRGFEKPIYSILDRTDTSYPIKYYRQRYAPLHYNKHVESVNHKTTDDQLADTAVFEAIALEDRLLLVTTKGLVSFYGHVNATVAVDRQWTYSVGEVLNKCFKFVRILRRAQPAADTIVGITYNYVIDNTEASGPRYEEVSQQIWIGKFVQPGMDIEWHEIKPNIAGALNIERRNEEVEIPPGQLVTFPPGKEPALPYETREANPKSQIEAICYKVFRTQILQASDSVTLADEPGWCEAIDATPIVVKTDSIQVLVRLRVQYNPTSASLGQFSQEPTNLIFYIVAHHIVDLGSASLVWNIDAVIPRYPCIHEHVEAVKNVLQFNIRYFQNQKVGSDTKSGCHNINEFAQSYHVYLNGITYSRTWTNHLFLYGSRLLQSTDNGKSFVTLNSFPRRLDDFDEDASRKNNETHHRNVHRISLMAFDEKGHYAFLTNKLELWYGSTGSTEQILVRPSPLHSMVQLGISKVKGFNAGIPFTIDFDSNDHLYEMVAVVNSQGHVTRVMKRYVSEQKLLRIKHMLDMFDEHSLKLLRLRKKAGSYNDELQTPEKYDVSKWTTFCPFVSPRLSQNYSMSLARTQGMSFTPPTQHIALGKSHIEPSLMAFQAAVFSLSWESYFQPTETLLAGRRTDPFEIWLREKRDAAILEMLTFIHGNPTHDGLAIIPQKYKRIRIERLHSKLTKNYFVDLNVTTEIRLEFSIKNDLMSVYTDFEADQINDIELNVENANGSLIQINTEREVLAHKAAVLFVVQFSVKRRTGLGQSLPGHNIVPVPVTFHLIGAFGNCIENRATGIIGDSVSSVIQVGCPSAREFVFNWNSTLASIKFRDETDHGTNNKCPNREFVCFFARNPIVLSFDIFDESHQKFIPYNGKYTMRIVAGGRTKNSMKNYTREEIEAFNIPGVSDVSLIWNEWDPLLHQKVERKPQVLYDHVGKEVNRDNRESILHSGKSTIVWACHTLSPCARVRPTRRLEVVFWFRLQISNRDVDNNTLCLYEKEFDLLLYGFPPSPEFQLFTTLGFCFFLLGILYACYLCFRRQKRLWRTTKVTVRNWAHIIKDVFPKKLRIFEPALGEEGDPQKRRARELGSHDLSRENSATSLDRDSTGEDHKRQESRSSLGGFSSMIGDSSSVLPDNRTHILPVNASEVVYDQILARRLESIVQRNKAMRQNLISKASVQMPADEAETEVFFERQFGRTVSQESVFTPPMPKDKSRGIDSFF